MNEMRTMDYRDDYREDYRDYRNYRDYRDEYGRNQRDEYGRNRRSYRNYRGDYIEMLEEIVDDTMKLTRAYEDIADMTGNQAEKQKIMKMAEREKEHHRMIKDILENKM